MPTIASLALSGRFSTNRMWLEVGAAAAAAGPAAAAGSALAFFASAG